MLGLTPVTSGIVLYKGNNEPVRAGCLRAAAIADVVDVVLMMGRVRKAGWFRRFSSVSRQIAAALERVGMSDYRDRLDSCREGNSEYFSLAAR